MGESIRNVSQGSGSDFTKACVLILLAASLSLLLKSFGFKGAPVFMAALFCAVASHFAGVLAQVALIFDDLASVADISEYTKACVKVIGVGYLAGISADTCREIGEGAAARCISILARVELIAISMPFVRAILDSALALMGE